MEAVGKVGKPIPRDEKRLRMPPFVK